MKELIGKTILGIRVNADQSVMAFDTDKGTVAYSTYSDCCSETWFADIFGAKALLGGMVREASEIAMPDYNADDGRGRQQSDAVYGVKLVTDKGQAEIVYRNSSNGYYGGSVDPHSGKLPADMTAITDDWRA